MTVRDLIESSLRLIGVLASGENMTASEGADALSACNQLLETWNLDNLMLYTINRDTFSLIPGTQSYTMGTGGTLSSTRPVRIENASIIPVGTPAVELPIEIIRDEEWQAVTVKSTSSTFPLQVYPDGGFPLNTLYFWPTPSTACQVVLYTWNQLTAFASLTDTISLPPGYARALRFCLAVDLAPEYGIVPNPVVGQTADTSRDWLRKVNWTPSELTVDAALLGGRGSSVAAKSRGYVVDL